LRCEFGNSFLRFLARNILMDLAGSDLDNNVTCTILAEAGQNGTPASQAAVASVIRNRLAAGGIR
jgi:hypothetical protein